MKHRTPAKRITSILLGLQMVLLQPLCSLAEIPQQSPTVIAGARLSEDQLTDGELVYFGVSGLTLKEAADSYEIAIYREGNLDQEASVTVHTLDISALYNEDYRLLGDDITELESGKTLLQQAADRGREETDDESEVGDTDDTGPSSGSEDTDVDSDAIASGSEIASKGSEISDSDERALQGTEYRFDADGNLIGETGKTSPEEVLEWVAQTAQSEAEAGKAEDAEKIEHADEAEDAEASEDIDEDEHTDEDTNEMAKADIEVSSHARKLKKASPSELNDDDEDEAFDENDPAEDVEGEEEENRDADAANDDFDDEEANASDLDSVASASVLSVAGSDAVSSTKSRLAMLKEAATGEPTREEGSSGVSGSLTDAILSQILPEQVTAIPHSAEQTIHFAPGEDVQYLRFRICDDDRAEGTEAFSVMITDAENMEPYKVTSLSVIITDDEASEQSALSFDSDEFIVEDGKALVTLQREGAEYSMASANIRGKDA